MKTTTDIPAEDRTKKMIRSKLPKDLELRHENDIYGGCYVIREKKWFGKSVFIDLASPAFELFNIDKIPLVKKLSKIFPKIPVIIRTIEVEKALKEN